MRRALLLVGLLVALPQPRAAAAAADPWKFAGAGQKEAEKKYPDQYWYVHYPKAVALLKNPEGNADEAIARLKLAIVSRPDSKPDSEHPITHEAIPYFPYYHLALAFVRKGDYEAARRCLEKESPQIARTNLVSTFNDLKGRVAALAEKDDLVRQADRALNWEGGKDFGLSPEGMAGLARIRVLKEKLGAPGADARAASQELTAAMLALFRNEVKKGASLLARFSGEPWRAAFAGNPGLIDPSPCKEPPGEDGVNAVKAAGAAVEQCGRAVLLATRQAGGGDCGRLAGLRAGAERSAREFRAWVEQEGGAPSAAEPPADLPKVCALKWTEMTGSKAAESFDRLDAERTNVGQALEETRRVTEAKLGTKRDSLRRRLEEVLSRLPGLPDDCVQILQLGQTTAKVKAFRERLAQAKVGGAGVPSKEILQADQQVQPLLDDLVGRVRDGVQQLRKNRACPGVTTANLDRLPAGLEAYMTSRASSELESLCAVARGAAGDVQDCWKRNIPFVRAGVDRNVTLAGAAHQAMASIGDSAAPKELVDRLAGSLATLRAVQSKPPGADPAAWVEQARSAQEATQTCLNDARQALHGHRARIVASMRDTRETLRLVSSLLPPAGAADPAGQSLARLRQWIEEASGLLAKLDSKFAAVGPLFEAKGAPSGTDVQRVLRANGLGEGVPETLWELLATEAPAGGQDQDVPVAVLDAALVPDLNAAQVALEQWRPVIGKLGPLAVLNGAFLAFSGGDLDGAILSLRAAQTRGLLGERGKEAALAHAALAYFLFAKSSAVSARQGDTELIGSLKDDVEHEACLAVRADTGFRLPEDLFRNQSFKRAFLAYTGAGNC
ncbi:MAG: hypothetical protein HYS34_01780 [Acidobacteria bacterium]|nr:hypothetical protein [Acidobacteriota bacterium]